jgi:hypothetical protein
LLIFPELDAATSLLDLTNTQHLSKPFFVHVKNISQYNEGTGKVELLRGKFVLFKIPRQYAPRFLISLKLADLTLAGIYDLVPCRQHASEAINNSVLCVTSPNPLVTVFAKEQNQYLICADPHSFDGNFLELHVKLTCMSSTGCQPSGVTQAGRTWNLELANQRCEEIIQLQTFSILRSPLRLKKTVKLASSSVDMQIMQHLKRKIQQMPMTERRLTLEKLKNKNCMLVFIENKS